MNCEQGIPFLSEMLLNGILTAAFKIKKLIRE